MSINRRTFLALPLAYSASGANVTVSTSGYGNGRTAANNHEPLLTPTNVTSLRLLGRYPVDDYIFTQPLYVPGITVGGVVRNIVMVGTQNNSLYAFDADRPGTSHLWIRNFGAPGSSPVNLIPDIFYGHGIGCLATPVVDVPNSKVHTLCRSSSATWVLRSVNLTTGAVIDSVTVSGQVPGTGDPFGGDTTSGGNLLFSAEHNMARPALTLANGRIYLFFGSWGDSHPYHGWAIAYDASTYEQVGIFCTSPNSFGGSIWMAGAGAAVDGSGNLYVTTGNGPCGDGIYGDSILKFDADLNLVDWFKPAECADLDTEDADVSSGHPILIPGTNLLVMSSKNFKVYVLDTTDMGHLEGSSGAPLQVFLTSSDTVTGTTGSFGGLYFNNRVYYPITNGPIYSFLFDGAAFNETPVISSITSASPGAAQLTGSGNGSQSGLVWTTTVAASTYGTLRAGTLRALHPVTLAEIWNSDTDERNALGYMSKYAAPTVANGKVYVSTQSNYLAAYGLLPSASIRGPLTVRGPLSIR